ncbi:MAG: TIGR00730 family Rossman fold protein [Planctomycetes bacterium]|nr:TIGR00730 family Rossman fold protein [Planctomycetota bacterium]
MQSSNSYHQIQRVCVFCGSNTGTDPNFRKAAEALGTEIARRRWGMVYGGGSIGLMGVVADAVLAANGEVFGVIPEMLATKELLHTGVTRMHIAPSMHARKALMEQSADAFVAMPGGFGTFEELLEIITWAQLGLHAKPIGILNVGGFYNSLIDFFEKAITTGFIKATHRQLFVTAASPGDLLDKIVTHEMPQVKKWIRPSEG